MSLIISTYLFLSNIMFSMPFQKLRNGSPRYFFDDRDGWLQLASAVSKGQFEPELTWQLAVWPPGNIGILSLGNLIFQSTFMAAIFHIFIVALVQAILVYLILRNIITTKRNSFFLICIVIGYHLSFIYRSAFIDTVLFSDYLGSILLCCGIILLNEFMMDKYISLQKAILIVVFLSASAYVRITGYQIILSVFLISIAIGFLRIVLHKPLVEQLRKIILITVIIILTFVPWIVIRSEIAYNGNYLKGVQFSNQGKLALGLQWADVEDFNKYPEFELMGLGIACKIDPIKCKYFSERENLIENGILNTARDDEFEKRSLEALKTFVTNPAEWISLKSNYIPSTYFQSSVYDTVDGKIHFSLDLFLIILLVPYNIAMLIRLNDKQSKLFISAIQLIAFTTFIQLFLTQVLLRFYLPSIMLTLLCSILLSKLFLQQKSKSKSEILGL